MSDLDVKLSAFSRRVKWMAAWRGAAIGACAGGVLAAVWAVLDWLRVLYAEWAWLGVLALVMTLVGAIVGAVRKVDVSRVAASVDRRAHLQDRLSTAIESTDSLFDTAQVRDATQAVQTVKPSEVFPTRFGRWQMAALASLVLAASIFLLGNSPVARRAGSAAERKELKEMGQKVERVAKPLEQQGKVIDAPKGTRQLAGDLNRFAKELEHGKLNKEEAIRKANDLAKKAENESKTRADEAMKKTAEAETSLGKYQKLRLEEAGVTPEELENINLTPEERSVLDKMMQDRGFSNPESKFSSSGSGDTSVGKTAEQLSKLSPQQREQLRQDAARRQQEIQKEIDRLNQLSPEERAKAEAQMNELKRQQQEMQKLSEALKLSEETMQAIRELMQSEEMRKLQEALSKMQQGAQQSRQGQPMTKEQIEELRQQLEELAKAMKDPEMREQIMQQLREALKQLESGQMSAQAMQQMLEMIGQQGLGGSNGSEEGSGAGSQNFFPDTGMINKSEKEMKTSGKGSPTRVKGEWDDTKGEQWSVTVKAPTQVGNRSSVPYQSVMPKYKKAAEKALSGGKIPREKEKRVKEYFDSLSGGR